MKRVITFEEAKARYVHRFTMQHVPAWSQQQRGNGTYYAPQFRTCREWYDKAVFPGEGHVRPREAHCFSSGQSWPLGQSLTHPYTR